MFRRSAVATAATALAVAYLFTIGPSASGQEDLDCGDLSYEQAQAELRRDPTDPHRLDADNDGEACEDSERGGGGSGAGEQSSTGTGGGTDSGRTPAGGVETGAGGMASNDAGSSSSGWFAVVGAAALATAGALRLRRTR